MNSYLMHYGITGQKWGVRRFQNKDGTLTAEGKARYDTGCDSSQKSAQAEAPRGVVKISTNSAADLSRDKMLSNRPSGYSKKENAILDKVQRGEELSSSEKSTLKGLGSTYHQKGNDLAKQLRTLDSVKDKDKIDSINAQISDIRAKTDFGYHEAPALDRENDYKRHIYRETNPKYIDPSYRKFSSKEEKAKAEADYLSMLDEQSSELSDDQKDLRNREIGHMTDRVWNLSMDGYNGIPHSERNKAMFTYDPDDDFSTSVYSTYRNWKPKYKESKEWKDLQDQRAKLKDDLGYDKAYSDYQESIRGQKVNSIWNYGKQERLWDAFVKVRREYDKKTADIAQKEKDLEKAFNQKIAKNVLLDLGFEVNDQNLSYIKNWIWYD